MKWIVRKSNLKGSIAIPPSKSHTIRALLVATLADGQSTIRKPLIHGDGESAIGVAQALGAEITRDGSSLLVKGCGSDRNQGTEAVFCGNSGTSTTLFMSAAALGSKPRTFSGDDSLHSRPVWPLLDALSKLGASYTILAPVGDLPFTIQGPIRGGETLVNGISSQFVSSLLFSCPLAPDDTAFTVTKPQEKPYIALTLWWLKRCGIIHTASPDCASFSVKGGQSYRPIDIEVPADFSSATFAAVAAALTRASLTLTGLDFSDPQGDKGMFDILEQMGARVKKSDGSVVVDASSASLKGFEIDLNAMPDSLPAISVLATQIEGTTRIRNVAQARIKETDRIRVMAEELAKLGAQIEELPDGLVIHPSPLTGTAVNGHGDHRVVMALALAGMAAGGETVIDSVESSSITYPTFAQDFRGLGADIRDS